MAKSYSNSYKDAGVDITAGYRSVELMKKHIARTAAFGRTSDVGGFGGTFELGTDMKEPVLVSGTDGVGTKLRIAMLLDRHDTVGIDCVAMCVNDIICCGAKPLFFLDYIAMGKNIPEKTADIVSGVAEGCVRSECALVGGETAEHPGMMAEDDYDIAGFAVGIVDKSDMPDKNDVNEGDAIIALPSSGVHSNGFSLIRKVFDIDNADLTSPVPELDGISLGETLLTPTVIYVKPVLDLIGKVRIKSLAHITGGGFYENIPRSLPEGLSAMIKIKDVMISPVFDFIAKKGEISEHDMFNTFNMGVGMTAVTSSENADKALAVLTAHGIEAYRLGTVVKSEEGVILC